MDRRALIDLFAGHLGMLFQLFVIAIAVGLGVRHNRKQREKAERLRQFAIANPPHPLDGAQVCTSCGWFGWGGKPYMPGQGPSAGQVVGVIGGVAVGTIGIGTILLGVFLILLGIPLLFFFGIGLLPIFAGIALMSAGGTATTVGATVGSAAAFSGNKRPTGPVHAPCPGCKHPTLIPAISPRGLEMIGRNPQIRAAASDACVVIEARQRALGHPTYRELHDGDSTDLGWSQETYLGPKPTEQLS